MSKWVDLYWDVKLVQVAMNELLGHIDQDALIEQMVPNVLLGYWHWLEDEYCHSGRLDYKEPQ